MFGNNSQVQLAVLQERFKAHEQIIDKVDAAIQTLSETNQNICKMLAVHDERINVCSREDESIVEKIGQIEVKLEDVSRIKWMTVGCGVVLVVLVAAFSSLLSGWWTPSEMQMQRQGHVHQQNVSD